MAQKEMEKPGEVARPKPVEKAEPVLKFSLPLLLNLERRLSETSSIAFALQNRNMTYKGSQELTVRHLINDAMLLAQAKPNEVVALPSGPNTKEYRDAVRSFAKELLQASGLKTDRASLTKALKGLDLSEREKGLGGEARLREKPVKAPVCTYKIEVFQRENPKPVAVYQVATTKPLSREVAFSTFNLIDPEKRAEKLKDMGVISFVDLRVRARVAISERAVREYSDRVGDVNYYYNITPTNKNAREKWRI